MLSQEHEKFCKILDYIEYLIILASTVSESVSISTFSSLVGSWSCAIAEVIKKCKLIVKKKKCKHNKTAFLAKTKLKTIEDLISKD